MPHLPAARMQVKWYPPNAERIALISAGNRIVRVYTQFNQSQGSLPCESIFQNSQEIVFEQKDI